MTTSATTESRSRGLRPAQLLSALVLLGLGLGLTACSRSGSGTGNSAGSVASLQIISCSLGCAPADSTISCGPLNIAVNELISVEFNDEIDLETVDKNTFRVVEVGSGAVPAGSFQLDPGNPRRLLYRPALTFDSQGNPIFGLNADSTYQLTIPGRDKQGGPVDSFIRSKSGRPNAVQLDCALSATEGVRDLSPGAPEVQVFLDVVEDDESVTREVLANEDGADLLRNIYQDTKVKIVFDDVMNPATVVNPVTGLASLIEVLIDPDGNVEETGDQVELPGKFTISLDQIAFTTTVTFTPSVGLPSGISSDGVSDRLLVVNLPAGIVDLGENKVSNGGIVAAVPEEIVFTKVLLPPGGENFSDTDFRDERRTGAFWGPTVAGAVQGALAPGTGGGSGRLGDLLVSAGSGPLVFDTDSTVFDSRELLTTYDEVTGELDPIEVDDGIFEFSSITVRPGAVLRFEGSQAARVFARGTMLVQGIVDVTGESLDLFPSMPCDVDIVDSTDPFYCAHLDPDIVGVDPVTEADSLAYLTDEGLIDTYFDGQAGGSPGAGGAAGGKGGDLPSFDASLVPSLADSKGLNNLDAVIDLAGSPGDGVPVPNVITPVSTAGGGGGGVNWPPTLPETADDWEGDLVFGDGQLVTLCFSRQTGGGGAGGASATEGAPSKNANLGIGGGGGPLAPDASGGDALEIVAVDGVETLDPYRGLLRGGAGGGGAGAGAPDSQSNGMIFNCVDETTSPIIVDYRTSRGGGGGGGGGAVQLQAGKRLVLDGVVDASGGRGGGSGNLNEGTFEDRLDDTAPGGGGGGGSILLQAEQVELAAVPGRLRIAGGDLQKGAENAARGGAGGLGRLRVESGLSANELLSINSIKGRVTPNEEDAADYPGEPSLDDIVSVVNWDQVGLLDIDPALIDVTVDPQPELRSAGQSCWLKPAGNVFFTKLFEDTPNQLGWDMDIFIAGFNQTFSYRTPSTALGGLSPEEFLDLLDSPPIQVRFQGARAVGPVDSPCDAAGSGSTSPFVEGSLTPWVRHPAELNDINGNENLRPNWIRYQVVFDRNVALPNFPAASALDVFPGITSFFIRAQGE